MGISPEQDWTHESTTYSFSLGSGSLFQLSQSDSIGVSSVLEPFMFSAGLEEGKNLKGPHSLTQLVQTACCR